MPAGFYFGANNPYLRSIWFKVRRAPKGLNPDMAMIGPDANPAHIIFECMTDRDWGMGGSPAGFDVSSFNSAAQLFLDEEFGMSLMWTRSATIEAFVNEILDHVQATLFVNPRTGLITLNPLREDFNISELRVIYPGNATLTNFQRKAWGETSNEVVVTYTNPENEEDATVSAQALANIAQQGGVVTSSSNYYGVRNAELAGRLAQRDLRINGQPLATADVSINRSGWDVLPGEVMLLTWPEKGIEQLVVRAEAVNRGAPGSGKITFKVYEDVFSLSSARYLSPTVTEWVDPSETPAPLDYALLLTAPAFFSGPALALANESEIEYPEVITMILAAPDSRDDQGFELIGQTTTTAGALTYTSFGSRQLVDGAALAAAIPAEIETFIPTFADARGASPLAGSIVIFGEDGDLGTEFALVKEVTEDGWHFTRGVLDTVPRAWPAGTRVWSLGTGKLTTDTTLRSDGETVEYRLLTRTSKGLLPFEDATPESITLTGRPHLPFRPAGVQVNGYGFGTVDLTGLTSIGVSWKTRNRLQETSQVLPWNADSVAPEAGQTTTVRLLKTDETEIVSFTGITGNLHSLVPADFDGETSAIVEVFSERDGLESLQGHQILVTGIGA